MSHVAADDLIGRALTAARELCGMDIAYFSEFVGGRQVVHRLEGDPGPIQVAVGGDGFPLEETYCQRMVDGRLTCAVPDTHADPVTAALEATDAAHLGAYVGVPLRLPDGRLYGTLCCAAADARPQLGDQEVAFLQMLARIIGEQIAEAEATTAAQRVQDELFASISHDLRTPLMAVLMVAEELGAGDRTPDEVAGIITRETRRVLRMIDDLLLVARQRSGEQAIERRPADLGQVAREAVASVALAAGADAARIEVDLPEDPPVGDVDVHRVARALENLLANALKYSPDGGPVRLTLRASDGTATFAVRDEGIGIDPEDVERLGHRFFRAATATGRGIQGTGLGLASVLAVAALHEGTLTTTSAPGHGSTFTLRLPLRRQAA